MTLQYTVLRESMSQLESAQVIFNTLTSILQPDDRKEARCRRGRLCTVRIVRSIALSMGGHMIRVIGYICGDTLEVGVLGRPGDTLSVSRCAIRIAMISTEESQGGLTT